MTPSYAGPTPPPPPFFFSRSPNQTADSRLLMPVYPPTQAKPEPKHQGKEESKTLSNQSLPPLPLQLRNPPPHSAIRGQLFLILPPPLLLLLPNHYSTAIPIRHLHLPAPRLVRPRTRLEAPAHRLDHELVEAPAGREVGVLCEGVGEAGEDVFLGGCAEGEGK